MATNNDNWLGSFTNQNFCESIKERENEYICNTNLSDVCGNLLIEFSKALDFKSPSSPNKRILEMVIRHHPYVYRNENMIHETMDQKERMERTIMAFAKLGIHDYRCTVEWLIKLLFSINEFTILKSILKNGPIRIEKKYNDDEAAIEKPVSFKVTSIQPYHYKWKHDNLELEEFGVVDDSFSTKTIKIVPKKKGKYELEINSEAFDEPFTKSFNVESPEDISIPINEFNRTNERIALLIGCCDYEKLSKLTASRIDIPKLDKTLRQIGYEVFSFIDINLEQFEQVIKGFSKKICKNTTFFMYFGGHGNSEFGKDQAILIDGRTMPVVDILSPLKSENLKAGIAIFDMCRDSNTEGPKNQVTMPFLKDIHYIPTTQPFEKAFEKEKSSVIIEPLINSLSLKACTSNISDLVQYFSNEIKQTKFTQHPGFLAFECKVVLGKKLSVPTSRVSWISNNSELVLNASFPNDTYNKLIVEVKDKMGDIKIPNYSEKWEKQKCIDLFRYFENKLFTPCIELQCRNKSNQIFHESIKIPLELGVFFNSAFEYNKEN